MRPPFRLFAAAALGTGLWVGAAGAAGADPVPPPPAVTGGHAVFVQTNDPTGNAVVSYRQQPDGQLTEVGRYSTGGLGVAIGGAVVDKLASQGSLQFVADRHLLVAVNGGSDTLAVFHAQGAQLSLAQTISSGGSTPVSVAVSGDLVYVLDAGDGGGIQGYTLAGGQLVSLPGSWRPLGLDPDATPPYLNTPGQIGFTPDGDQLVVTTKANGNDIDVFGVRRDGTPDPKPVVNPSADPVPFGFVFDPAGRLVVTGAGDSALTTYVLHADGKLTEVATATNGQSALCWVAETGGGLYFGANAGSGTVTSYGVDAAGQPSVLGETTTDPGPIDLAVSPDGSSLYVETGADGIVDGFAVGPDGTLSYTGSVAPELPGHGGLEGIAVS